MLDICWKGHLLQTIVKAWCFQSLSVVITGGHHKWWSKLEISQPEMLGFQGPNVMRKSVLSGKPPGVGCFVCSGWISLIWLSYTLSYFTKKWNISQIKFHLIQFLSEPCLKWVHAPPSWYRMLLLLFPVTATTVPITTCLRQRLRLRPTTTSTNRLPLPLPPTNTPTTGGLALQWWGADRWKKRILPHRYISYHISMHFQVLYIHIPILI